MRAFLCFAAAANLVSCFYGLFRAIRIYDVAYRQGWEDADRWWIEIECGVEKAIQKGGE